MIKEGIPESHAQEAQLLESAGFATLLTIEMLDPVVVASQGGSVFLRLTPLKAVTVWQLNTYESLPFSLTGLGTNSSGEVVRPKLLLPNAAGAFSLYAHQGWLNNAFVTRQLVRTEDLANDVNSFSQKCWRVSKVINLTKSLITVELRSVFDGQSFKVPPRAYFPPEFPSVRLR